jgi:PTS system ascorbate-specific IIC component
VVGAVQSANLANIGAEIAWTMRFGYVVHILVSRFSKHHYILSDRSYVLGLAGAFAILFHSFGLPTWGVVLCASIVDGL